jgi:glycerophosphoryl diester phosphodiesterase
MKGPGSPAESLLSSSRPLVIGHRGFCQLAPENTLPSFKLALAAGVDLVELDFRVSQDGYFLVIHDAKLDRTTDARIRWKRRRTRVADRTAIEIQSLDAGSWFHQRYAGTKVPLLSEALDIVQAQAMTLLERKAGEPRACIEVLRRRHEINRVIVQAFDWEFLRRCHELEPAQVLGALGPPTRLPNGRRPLLGGKALGARWLDALQATGARIAVWDRRVSRAAVAQAHRRGLKVWVYTINQPRLAKRLLDRGVDGLITNNPSLIWKTIALRPEASSR